MSDEEAGSGPVTFARSADFWTVIGLVTAIGLTMGFVALVYVGAIEWLIDFIWVMIPRAPDPGPVTPGG